MDDTLVLIVSGQRFEIDRNVFEVFPESTLGRLASSKEKTATFYRPTSMFKAVLAFYETGNFHLPSTVCMGSVKDEIEFWGFTVDDLDLCCRRNLKKFYREQTDLTSFENSLSYQIHYDNCCRMPDNMFTRGRRNLWLILASPNSSAFAMVYFIVSSLVIILSVLVSFLGTLEDFRSSLTSVHWKEIYGDNYVKVESAINDEMSDNPSPNKTGNATIPQNMGVENGALELIGVVCSVFFCFELFLKFCCCPNIIVFFKNFLNITDALAVAVSLADILCNYLSPLERFHQSNVDAIGALQVLRVLRLFRLARNITGARVLFYAIINSLKELGFMGLLVAINTIVFGTLAYNLNREVMKDLAVSSWWALVTMTTVGYGDVVPSNHLGRLVGVLCACMGILVLAITMPLFVNNFLAFYSYANDICKETRIRQKTKRNSVQASEKRLNGTGIHQAVY